MKRVIVFLLLVIIPIFSYAALKGDVDGNNKVGSSDYVLVRKHILKQSILSGDRLSRADVNGDGKVSSLDFIGIRKIILDKDTTTTPAPTSTPTPVLSEEDRICESVKNNASIDYKSFASLKKNNDDYYVIKAAHDCANKYGKPVVVTKATYNIYKKDEDEPIRVKTDTNFGGSKIYIHDEILEPVTDSSGSVVAKYDGMIFSIEPRDGECIKRRDSYDAILKIVVDSGYKYAYIRIENKKGVDTVFRRTGTHVNDGQAKTDAFRVKVTGGKAEVLDPLFWSTSSYNKDSVKSALICKIPDDKMTIQNGDFITIISSDSKRVDALKRVAGNTSRNIAISRSNIMVKSLTHLYVKSGSMKETDKVTYGYTGFYRFYNLADVNFKDSIVTALDGYDNIPGNSAYGLTMSSVANMTITHIRPHRLSGESFDDQLVKNLWGVNGTNYCKNVVFDDVKLNRIDAHCGIINVTVKNSTLGKYTISVTGSGSQKNNVMTLENVEVLSNYYVVLRGDYGSTWNGKIIIKNGTLRPMSSDIAKKGNNAYIIRWNPNVQNNTLHNYGYNLYLPDIEINGLNIKNNKITNLYVYEQSKSYFDSLKADGFTKYYNPTIKKSGITGGNGNLIISDYGTLSDKSIGAVNNGENDSNVLDE